MTIERASIRPVAKPWGAADRRPWSSADPGQVIGEIWFDRPGRSDPNLALLLKVLFTRQPLSIQVHPDDAMAHGLGLPRGKTEAWYVLAAEDGAQVARGLREAVTDAGLETAITDGSIADLVEWHDVHAGDVVAIPAGTIHALGAGLVVAELQQRSDTTYRLFDFGRDRELHKELGVAASDHGLTAATPAPRALSEVRTLLVACPYFVFERVSLPPGSHWEMVASTETWLLVIEGSVSVGPLHADVGEAIFLERERTLVRSGVNGVTALVGTVASEPDPHLLTDVTLPPSTKADA